MKKEIFKKGIAILATLFPEKQLDAGLCWEFLNDLTDERFMQAVVELSKQEREINKAHNIIAIIREKACIIDRITSGEAWGEVRKQISSVGHYGIPKFSSPTIQRAVDCMGWISLCVSESPSYDRDKFMKIYDSLKDRADKEQIINPQNLSLVNDIVKKLGKIV